MREDGAIIQWQYTSAISAEKIEINPKRTPLSERLYGVLVTKLIRIKKVKERLWRAILIPTEQNRQD